jgi:hypothetical protein
MKHTQIIRLKKTSQTVMVTESEPNKWRYTEKKCDIINTSMWKNFFSQLLNVHRVGDVRQMEIYTAVPLYLKLVLLRLNLLLEG